MTDKAVFFKTMRRCIYVFATLMCTLPLSYSYATEETSTHLQRIDFTQVEKISFLENSIPTEAILDLKQRIEAMEQARNTYQAIVAENGWSKITLDRLLRQGDEGEDVGEVIARLAFEYPEVDTSCLGFFKNTDKCFFSEDLEKTVRHAQQRYGLNSDGIIGQKTLEALNVSAHKRYQQIVLNLERIQTFYEELGESYILVNIPEFKLRYVKGNRVIADKRVVVGRPDWETPSFTDQLEKFVVNPEWRIPVSIARKKIVPKAIQDPDYLEENNIIIRKRDYFDDETVDPEEIDWRNMTPNDFRYYMVKLPHEKNPMGEVKYLFPNSFSVYIHDTPDRDVFANPVRAASHGCIRLEDPFSLAKIIAYEEEDRALISAIEEARVNRETKVFHLENPLDVHLVYWTAWADESNHINFRKDIYERDSYDQLASRSYSDTTQQKGASE